MKKNRLMIAIVILSACFLALLFVVIRTGFLTEIHTADIKVTSPGTEAAGTERVENDGTGSGEESTENGGGKTADSAAPADTEAFSGAVTDDTAPGDTATAGAGPTATATDGSTAPGAGSTASGATTAGTISATPTYKSREEFVQAQLKRSRTDSSFWDSCPTRDIELLPINEYSRPGIAIDSVNTLVIHYVGNSGSSAMDNRNYFESLKDSHDRSASSHFVIGLDGEIVQCIPLSEIAYATKWRNRDTISIECCHPGDDGKFNEYTYWSLVELSAFLCRSFDIDPQTILRHYDVTEKLCPLYYVEHPDAWQAYKDAVEAYMNEGR